MTGLAAVVRSNDFTELCSSHLMFAYFEECPDNGTNHVAQEAIGSNDEIGFGLGLLNPSRFPYIADCGLDISVRAAERGKVLFAQ